MEEILQELRDWLLDEHALTISGDRITAITPHVQQVVASGVQGAFVELGCHRGAMSVWVRSLLDALGDTSREIHVFDSFQGLPEPDSCDSNHVKGGDLIASPKDVVDSHKRWGKELPFIHPGWFDETLPVELPKTIAFGYLDGDFYGSIMTSLKYCVPRMAPGGILIIDDYADVAINPQAWNGLPGVKQACDDFFGGNSPVEPIVLEGSDLPFGIYRNSMQAGA
ncbi:TylF/MycF/NovP-related O-methyltransferase [Streptomyces europaeiscabiei]|uniref:TylF/MycF/NovP-related O-methyltransferase n=1 Tax=Streptomyces europaeiscabiei TaxID=146819 RepID=UPI0029B8B417|nr:TylF/MycF/NovP-related O-methyltransferase [Streptomyces europaeiscabiei]MDX2525274.1 macrocin O-methyltransferase [Streptomyces europaeiscabiei]